MEKRFYFLLL